MISKLTRRLFLSLAGLALSLQVLPTTAVRAGERVVQFPVDGQTVMGTLNLPDGVKRPPVVLMLHGFTGNRNELPIAGTTEGVFSRTARLLAESGYASLRIDFRGSGESEGRWAATTFSGQIRDGIAAFDWLKANRAVDSRRIALLGWSQGGLVAAHVAAQRPAVRTVTLWAPVAAPLATYAGLLGAETVARGMSGPADAPITAKLPWGAETTLNGSFFQELPTTSPIGAIARYRGPLQVIVGTRDVTVTPQPASGQIFLTYHRGPERLDVFDTDHAFSALTGPEVIDGKMVPATLAWLKAHL